MARPKSSKQLILDYFLANRGKILESRDIQAASGGAVEWARRVREMRKAIKFFLTRIALI